MLIGITTVAYNQADPLLAMAASAISTTEHDIQFQLFLHSEIKRVEEACEKISSMYPCAYYPIKRNAGLSRSWNEGLLQSIEDGCDVLMLVNDDIKFSPGDIDTMVGMSLANEDAWAVLSSGFNISLSRAVPDHGFSCMILNRVAIDVVGMFDENFFPAYNEDLDYSYRARLANLMAVMATTNIVHIGSAAIKASPLLRAQNHVTHGKNDEYWKRKWGAPKPNTAYIRPFSCNVYHPYYISPESRRTPYPGNDRTDHEIVAL